MPEDQYRTLIKAIRKAKNLDRFDDLRASLVQTVKIIAVKRIRVYHWRNTNLVFEEIWRVWRERFGSLCQYPWDFPKVMMREVFFETLEFLEMEGIIHCRRVPWFGTIYEVMGIPEHDRKPPVQKRLFDTPVGRHVMPILSITAEPKDIERFERALINILQKDPSPEELEEYAEARTGLSIEFMPQSLPFYKGKK